jgi:hypothetical protein
MRRLFVLLASLSLVAVVLAVEPPVDSHRAAADELLQLMDVRQNMSAGVQNMVATMTRGNPKMEPFRDVILQWANTYMNWENFGPKLTQMYVESFSEPELRDLLAFYRTPTGKKALALMPEMSRRGMQLGSDIASEHATELRAMIAARAAELEKAKAEKKDQP